MIIRNVPKHETKMAKNPVYSVRSNKKKTIQSIIIIMISFGCTNRVVDKCLPTCIDMNESPVDYRNHRKAVVCNSEERISSLHWPSNPGSIPEKVKDWWWWRQGFTTSINQLSVNRLGPCSYYLRPAGQVCLARSRVSCGPRAGSTTSLIMPLPVPNGSCVFCSQLSNSIALKAEGREILIVSVLQGFGR